MKSQKKAIVSFGIVMSLLVLSLGGFLIVKTLLQKTDVEKSNMKVDDYYSIRNNATNLQKTLYDELITLIQEEPENKLEISKLVAQNYVADFYTWSNKFRLNDIGGLQFINEDIRESVYKKAQDTTYLDLFYYLEEKKADKTLEVTDVQVLGASTIEFFVFDVDGDEEIYDDKTGRYRLGYYEDAILVNLSWDYKDSSILDPYDYDHSANVILMINDKGLPMIVEVNHDA